MDPEIRWPWLLLVVVMGSIATLWLLWLVPQKVEGIGVYWILLGLPWSLALVGAMILDLFPDGYPGLALLMLCVFINVAIIRQFEEARRQRK